MDFISMEAHSRLIEDHGRGETTVESRDLDVADLSVVQHLVHFAAVTVGYVIVAVLLISLPVILLMMICSLFVW